MSKSILVIDTPENCKECKFSDYQGIVCRAVGSNKSYQNADIKPDWCPLLDLPGKYEPVSMNFERGYNSCIDEILKGDDTERKKTPGVEIKDKLNLTVEEAAKYSNIGICKLNEILKKPNCPFVLYIGRKKLIKRREFEKYIATEIEL